MLAESFNPFVRFGAWMALGIGWWGTALDSALDILIPIMEEGCDFVRQGWFIALSLVLLGTTNSWSPKLNKIIEYLDKTYSDKY